MVYVIFGHFYIDVFSNLCIVNNSRGNVLFISALITSYLQLYGTGHMFKNQSGNDTFNTTLILASEIFLLGKKEEKNKKTKTN